MKDPILYKTILAALLHDLGKVYQRTGEKLPAEFLEKNRDLYQPSYSGYYTHNHVLYTAKFIEDLKEFIPNYFLQKENADYSLINLAAKHHKPESIWQLIISEADQLSSGYERRRFIEETNPEKGETSADVPLLSLFEDVSLDNKWKEGKLENYKFAYNLDKLKPESIFPTDRIGKMVSKEKYKNIWENFIQKFKQLSSQKGRPELWLESLNTLMLEYFLFVPSATVGISSTNKFEKIPTDISLYDHAYFTASLASTLYLYHTKTNTLSESHVQNRKEEKFLFIEGNFYGIQKFIFASGGETRKWAAKILRGRSFMVSLYTELVADYLLRELGLPFVNLLFSAAGKFLLLVPNIEEIKTKLKELELKINDWFYDHYFGEASIGLVYTEAKPEELLYENGYNNLMKRLGRKSEEKKYQKFDLLRYGGVIKNYFEKFSGAGVCKICDKRPAEIQEKFIKDEQEEIIHVCRLCNDHKKLGESLVKKKYILVFTEKNKNMLNSIPIFNKYWITFEDNPDVIRGLLSEKGLIHIWDLSLPKDKKENNKDIFAKKFINAYVPYDEESKEILTLEELAKKSLTKGDDNKIYGIEALGVIKADVDNLGTIFYRGLPESKRTFSRYLTLSRMLNLFFAYYLPYLCQTQYKLIYNVFSGGDDLFFIGPWKECYAFALKVNELFKKYVCNNSAFTISAGYVLTKPNLPIIELAEKTENALSQAKKDGKNRLNIFRKSISWEDIPELENLKDYLISLCSNQKEILSRSYLYKLNQILEMVEEAKRMISMADKNTNSKIDLKELENLLWPSLFYYFTVRNFDKKRLLKKEERAQKMEDFIIKIKNALEKHGEAFRLPLWQILYSTRRAGYDSK
ncbi:type III-A CRISPR-associated protein Cas10/Csm1 [Thermodesulfobacterium sp. TA1]|uniref:type III-A CRISPR-associated protein Cas10/Csm1 n=1 Tax=Thermodesulfobacterium sp. TA1 TaxID=2234087 RepID=UPI001231CED8|nr:type III-A CRISPR-associated protein Cas10/Csm1 [Thermodesulfobacterium sp. TA1]QER42717.1 type III-A CRISPR-associated protein Cas10/Csm1 [Thermodesulfobacterium sp. TA1]